MRGDYKAIICDLGNVLIDFDHRIAARKILKYTSLAEDEVYNLFFDSPLTAEYEVGKIDSQQFFKRVKELLSLDINAEGFFEIWEDIFFETPLNIRLQDYLRAIKPYYKMAMLSNINERHFTFLNARMEIFKAFDALVLSCAEGARKPERSIYEKALLVLDTSREKALYIDDRRDLVEAAADIGIEGIVFDGEEALNELSRRLNRPLPADSR